MIPLAHIQQWTAHAPWPDLRQVEQDLIICRALCDLFNSEGLRGKIAFRGGTAINKLLFGTPLRYSEDIDLVQTQQEPIGGIIDAIRDALSWLGKCNRTQAQHSMHLNFRFTPESGDGSQLKLKVEINTREHENLHGLKPTHSRSQATGTRRGPNLFHSFQRNSSAPSCGRYFNVTSTETCSISTQGCFNSTSTLAR